MMPIVWTPFPTRYTPCFSPHNLCFIWSATSFNVLILSATPHFSPLQITEKFKTVMLLAASKVTLDLERERIYFESCEGALGREILEDEEASWDEDEWQEEDYDHCVLLEDGKLEDRGDCLCRLCQERQERWAPAP